MISSSWGVKICYGGKKIPLFFNLSLCGCFQEYRHSNIGQIFPGHHTFGSRIQNSCDVLKIHQTHTDPPEFFLTSAEHNIDETQF